MKYRVKENDEIVEFDGRRLAVIEAWEPVSDAKTVQARAVDIDEEDLDGEFCAYLLEAFVNEDGTHEVIGNAGYEYEGDGGIYGAWGWNEAEDLLSYHPVSEKGTAAAALDDGLFTTVRNVR